ncbi:MAG: repeat protein [Myxococcaceae bacterium]|nr:repeat protein [Myxococcaceae bacterium]
MAKLVDRSEHALGRASGDGRASGLWTRRLRPALLVLGLALLAVGCHADPDDAAGQAKELSDPVRREFAVGNLTRLYAKALTDSKSDRSAPAVKGFVDVTYEPMVKTYLDAPEDTQNGERLMALFYEMRDPRTFPALLKALEWRTEVNEEHAITAARTLSVLQLSPAQKSEAAKKLATALDRVSGKRPVDNRMRVEFLRTLGELNDPAAAEVLTKVALRQSEEQNFLINNLAVEQLGRLADPATVPALIEALYLFDPSNPANRLTQTVPAALVRIGRPALTPLINVLQGKDNKALASSKAWIEAIRLRNAQAAATMNPTAEMKKEASFALGTLGFPEAIPPLLVAAADPDKGVQLGAAVALASINRSDADTPKIRDVMIKTYEAQEKTQRMQVLRAMQHLYDPGLQPFFMTVAKTPEEELPDIRVIALNAYAMLANKAEAAQASSFIAADKSPYKGTFESQNNVLLKVASECDVDVACWTKKLDDKDENVVRKATYMLARIGRGKPAVISALVGKLDHPKEMVRGDVLSALDYVAVQGAPEAVAKIEKIRKAEEGRGSWNHIKERALATQAKLAARGK